MTLALTGSVRISGAPFPTCPSWLRPQHRTPAAEVSAHVSPSPAATTCAPREAKAVVATGTGDRKMSFGTPSSPHTLSPQQRTAPVSLVATQPFVYVVVPSLESRCS